jgi:hypothetical protein
MKNEKHLYKGLPGIDTKGCDCGSDGNCNCNKPITQRVKNSSNGTLLKNK